MPEIVLKGCRPTPLASYLKAMAVFRLVAEQCDPSVKGHWRDDTFVLTTEKTKEDLVDFFVKDYRPTPVVSPWNGGSGFWPTVNTEGIDAIRHSTHERFAPYREAIETIFAWPEMSLQFYTVRDVSQTLAAAIEGSREGKSQDELLEHLKAIQKTQEKASEELDSISPSNLLLEDLETMAKGKKGMKAWWKAVKKARTKCLSLSRGSGKEDLLRNCRARLPEGCLDWMDAAIVLRVDDNPAYSPLLGSGGNEGNLDFSNNYTQRVAEMLLTDSDTDSRRFLQTALFAVASAGMVKASIGQLDPGRAGGYNQGCEIETKDFKINPWDFILAIEGTPALAGAATRRMGTDTRGLGSIPFSVLNSAVGFTSSNSDDNARAEIWLPTWTNPAGFREIRYIFGEGRSTVGRKQARSGLDFCRAVASLGVDRGFRDFQRFSCLARRGTDKKPAYLALPAGRMRVKWDPSIRLLDDLDPILHSIDMFLRGFKKCPATFKSARSNIDEAMFTCCEQPDAYRFVGLVRAIGRMERLIAQRDRSRKINVSRPLQGLRTQWILQCDDGSVEVRLAATLASIRKTGKVGSLRANMAGVDPVAPRKWANGTGQKHWHGCNLTERLGAVMVRRLMDAERLSAPCVPVKGNWSLSPHDVSPFLLGETDDALLEDLLWGFTLVTPKAGETREVADRWRQPVSRSLLPRSYAVTKLVHVPTKVRDITIRMEPRVAGLLAAGRLHEAADTARHRLRIEGARPLPIHFEEDIDPHRLLAALLVPVWSKPLENLILEDNDQA